jgi:hypothetical protein
MKQHRATAAGIAIAALALGVALPGALAKQHRGPEVDPVNKTLDTGDANDAVNTPAATAADEAMAKALAAMEVAAGKVRATFEESSDWTTASAAYMEARDDYHAKLKAATAGLSSNPQYAAAVAARDKAETDLDAMRTNGASADQITVAASALMSARSQVTQLQSSVIAGDATVQSAQQAMLSAGAAMDVERAKEKEAIAADPDWQAAKKNFDDAKAQAAAAANSPTTAPTTDSSSTPAAPPTPPAGRHHRRNNAGSGAGSSGSSNTNTNSNTNSNDQ